MQDGAERRFAQRSAARQIDKRVLEARRGVAQRGVGQGMKWTCVSAFFYYYPYRRA